MMIEPNKINGLTLLNSFLDLRSLAPDLADWTEERLSDNPPRLFRLRQLMALFHAFEIPWNPSEFLKGTFIQPQSPRYDEMVKLMNAGIPIEARVDPETSRGQLRWCFQTLMKYRERIERVLMCLSGLFEASGLYLYTEMRTAEMNGIIRANIGNINDLLSSFISPEAKEFSVQQLTRDYGYPEVDLDEIDADYF